MIRARFFAAATFAGASLAAAAVFAQTTQAPPQPVLAGKKFTPPVKGDADVDFVLVQTKREGTSLITKLQVKNTSKAPIARLRVAETWYDKDGNVVGGGESSVNGLLQPGEINSLEIRTPVNVKMTGSKLQFTHANGGIPKPHKVAKFEDADSKEPATKTASATKTAKKKK
jgi:hypothetical protein